MARLADIVFDCAKPAPLARFWAAALDGYEVEPYDDDIARLKSLGIEDIEDDPGVAVRSKTSEGPRYFFQQVPEAKAVKNRVHLDLRPADRAVEVERLTALGARRYTRWSTSWAGRGRRWLIRKETSSACWSPKVRVSPRRSPSPGGRGLLPALRSSVHPADRHSIKPDCTYSRDA